MDDSEKQSMRVPAFCPVCSVLMKGSKSNTTWYRYKACMNCFIEFIEDREDRWNSGWRPTAEQIERFVEKL